MKIKIRKTTYDLTPDEVKALRDRLTQSRFVALNSVNEVVAEGDEVTYYSHDEEGIAARLGGEVWNFFGDDNFVIVTREHYEAIKKAGL